MKSFIRLGKQVCVFFLLCIVVLFLAGMHSPINWKHNVVSRIIDGIIYNDSGVFSFFMGDICSILEIYQFYLYFLKKSQFEVLLELFFLLQSTDYSYIYI